MKIFPLSVCLLALLGQPVYAANPLKPQIDASLARIKAYSGIDTYYENVPESIWPKMQAAAAEEKDFARLAKYVAILEEELKRYPVSVYKKLQIQGIVLVKKFFYEDEWAQGLLDYKKDVIYLDFSRHSRNPQALRHYIHHELFHQLDIQAKGIRAKDDPMWMNLNAPGFVYGQKGGESGLAQPGSLRKNPWKGFVSSYARTDSLEDKAEVFAALMVREERRLIHRWAMEDPVLNGKIAFMKNYILRFCPEMDEKYWQDLFKP